MKPDFLICSDCKEWSDLDDPCCNAPLYDVDGSLMRPDEAFIDLDEGEHLED